MTCATRLLLCTPLGGVAAACVICLNRAYILASSEISPDFVPLLTLLTDVMELHRWAVFGGAVGFAGALLASLVGRVRRVISAQRTSLTAPSIGSSVDPDELIRAQCGGAEPPM